MSVAGPSRIYLLHNVHRVHGMLSIVKSVSFANVDISSPGSRLWLIGTHLLMLRECYLRGRHFERFSRNLHMPGPQLEQECPG
jgi:hypothetical protein